MKESTFFHRYKEIILGLGMIAFAWFYLNQAMVLRTRASGTIPVKANVIPGILGIDVVVSAKLIPALLGVIVLVFGVLQLFAGVRYFLAARAVDRAEGNRKVFVSRSEGLGSIPVILTFVIILGYAAVFEWLGFVISSTVCMFLQMMILSPKSKRKPIIFAVISVVVALVVYVAFRKGLNLSLPPGIFEVFDRAINRLF